MPLGVDLVLVLILDDGPAAASAAARAAERSREDAALQQDGHRNGSAGDQNPGPLHAARSAGHGQKARR